MVPKNKKRVILHLLRNLQLENINQIAKRLDISVGSAFKILKELEKNNLVSSLSLGNAKFYKLNFNNDETIHWCEIFLSEERRSLKGYSKLYAEEIQKFEHATPILLFGSILNGYKFNDVDVLFITNKPKEVNEFCLNLSKIRTKPVIPLILKKEDLINEINNKKESILSIVKTGVVLKGESQFIEILRNVKY